FFGINSPSPGALMEGRVTFSPDSRWLAIGTASSILVYDVAAAQLLYAVAHKGPSYGPHYSCAGISFTADGTRMLGPGRPGSGISLRVLDAATGAELGNIPGKRGQVYPIRWFRDCSRFASCDADGKALVQSADGQVLRTFTGHNGKVYGVAI